MNIPSVFILGSGGHAKVLIDCLKSREDIHLAGMIDIDKSQIGKKVLNVTVLGDESYLLDHISPANVFLVNGIGSTSDMGNRLKVFNLFKKAGYDFLTVIHPTAYIASDVHLGEGVQVMAGCIIQPGVTIGDNTLINTKTSIDHDCILGQHLHLAPGVTCCGAVRIHDAVHIGCGAVIKQNVEISNNSLVAAGAVVINNINMGERVAGIPAKLME